MNNIGKKKILLSLFLSLVLVSSMAATVVATPGPSYTYTDNADFDEGSSINVVHVPSDQLQLDDTTEAFNFIWVAVSGKGTVVKIDTNTGQVLGEYRTTPNQNGNPSRTTVDNNGSVWVGNRAVGTAIHIGLVENGQWVDRNGNGVLDTSTGFEDILPWMEDEAILHYVDVPGAGRSDVRHLSVTASNDVWASGITDRSFHLIDGDTGAILRSETSVNYGGYGGLIDSNGVIWSARNLLRWDTSNPITDPSTIKYNHDSYGLGIDSMGNVWNSALSGNAIRKFAPDGTLLGTYGHGDNNAQGVVADQNDHIWVAHSLYSGKNTVGHLLKDGTFIGNVTLDSVTAAQPTGVAVDANGYIWATGYNSQKVYKIDPNAGPLGADGVTPVGAVVLTTKDLGGFLYNYSDMTGSTLTGAPDSGTWTIVHDTLVAGAEWGTVSWTAEEPGDDSSITVTAASSDDGITFVSAQSVENGIDLGVLNGRYLKVSVSFSRSSSGESPILKDLTITAITNKAPVAVIDVEDETVPLPISIRVTPRTLNLERLGNWVKVHIKDISETTLQEMEVTLDGSSSYDDDGDTITYDWTLTGPEGDDIPVEDVESPVVTLAAGTYTATLVVDDDMVASDPVSVEFTMTNQTGADLLNADPSAYTLNGVPASEVKGDEGLNVCFDDDAIAETVGVGLDVEMVLGGIASGVDYIDVIQEKQNGQGNGKSDLKGKGK
ncbi:hypothetical protein ACFLX3_03020 [Chloroflexota bacterium]